jgi:hypothetical protein
MASIDDMMSVLSPPDQGPLANAPIPHTDSAGQPMSSGDIIVHARHPVGGPVPYTPPTGAVPIDQGSEGSPMQAGPAPRSSVDEMMGILGSLTPPTEKSVDTGTPLQATTPEPAVPLDVVPSDMTKGVVSGIEHFYSSIPGIPGTLSDLATRGMDWATAHAIGSLSGTAPEEIEARLQQARESNPLYWKPTIQNVDAALTSLGVPLYNYQPQSIPGNIAKTAGEFLPSAGAGLLGAGKSAMTEGLSAIPSVVSSIGKMVGRAGVPAIASESAGELAHNYFPNNPMAEQVARSAGAFAGSIPGALVEGAGGMLFSGHPDIVTAQAAQRAGVPMSRLALNTQPGLQQIGVGLKSVPFAGTPVSASSTNTIQQIGSAAERAARIPTGAIATPESGGLAMKHGLETYIGPMTTRKVSDLYDKVDMLINPAVRTPLNETATTVSNIAARRGAAYLPGGGKAVKMVMDAVQSPGLSYWGTKDLRTAIREAIGDPQRLAKNMSLSELKQIHSALSKDLRQSVANAGGPQAIAAFERANTYAKLVEGRREQLDKVLGHDRSPEGIAATLERYAGTSSAADIAKLRLARKSVTPSEWNELVSSVIFRMGWDKDGKFSAERFLSAYGDGVHGGISNEGKRVLFGTTGIAAPNVLGNMQSLRQSLDDIATLSRKVKYLHKYENPSGTAQHATTASLATSIGLGLSTGHVAAPLTAIGGILGGYGLARALSAPISAKAVDKWVRAYAVAARNPSAKSAAVVANASRALMSELAVSPQKQRYFGYGTQPRPTVH